MDLLVTTDWLADHLGADDLVVIDATVFLTLGADGYRSESGRARFEEGHIPGAVFGDLTGDLCELDSPDRFALPAPAELASALERLGVGDGRRVVLYDDNARMWSTRLWFMLRWLGFDDAAVLDGGMTAWRAEGRPLEPGPGEPTPAPTGYVATARRWKNRFGTELPLRNLATPSQIIFFNMKIFSKKAIIIDFGHKS